MSKHNYINYLTPILFTVLLAVMYGSFAYDLERSNFIKLITLFGGLFIITNQIIKTHNWNFKLLVGLGIVFRLIFIVAIPNLSQDFYRFLWDGHWVLKGVNPYLFTPKSYLDTPIFLSSDFFENAQLLYNGMGDLNGSHYTNYPPINQLLFALGALVGGKSILGNVLVLRLIIILADIGILYFGKKLLENLNLPIQGIFWYFLNPFIIIELTGNLHFEGTMLFFIVASLYFLQKRKWLVAAILLGVSISTKLIPLLFLPLFFQWFWRKKDPFFSGFRKLILFYVVVLATVMITFLPFMSSVFIENYLQTTALWFQNFEFNASVYYIIRWIGFKTIGWNIIESVGRILPLIIIVFVLGVSFFRPACQGRKNSETKQLISAMLLCISFYFLLATTVHPWYVATPLLLSLFTKYKFPILWSFMVIVSYSAYGIEGFSENYWLIIVEYSTVIGFAIWEIFFKNNSENIMLQKPKQHL